MKAIVFDFDGVIVFSEEQKFRFLQKNAHALGFEIDNMLFWKMIGRTTKVFFEDSLGYVEPKKLEKLLNIYNEEFKNKIVSHAIPIKVTVNFIENYKGEFPLAIASGSDFKVIKDLLESFGILNKIKTIVSKEDVLRLKPDPQAYLIAAKRLSVKPAEMNVVEDSIAGATAAISAKAKCFVFLNGINKKEDFKGMDIAGFLRSKEDFDINLI